MKKITIAVGAVAGIVLLSGCAYEYHSGPYAYSYGYVGPGPYAYNYVYPYGRYAYGYWPSRRYYYR